MPSGYLVTLGDYALDPNDAIIGPWTSFDTSTVLGAGSWSWSGTWGGSTYTDELEPGIYYLGTDGNVYFVPDYGAVDTLTSADVETAPAYTTIDGTVLGTDSGEVIDGSYTDSDGDSIDDGNGGGVGGNDDTVLAQGGNDTISSGNGNDLVYGGQGDDNIDGGDGNDLLYGDSDVTGESEFLDWSQTGSDGTNLSGGFSQTTGDISVSVSFTETGDNNANFRTETTDSIYVATGEDFDPNSSLLLTGRGSGDTSRTTFQFSAVDGSDVSDEVENVTFRISDIDWSSGNHHDYVTVNAFDANGDPVTVTLTPSGNDTVSGNTITAGTTSETSSDADGSVLVEIAGPVSEIQIEYSNGLSGGQAIWVSNVHFDTIFTGGDDTIIGGLGDDTLIGQLGSDSLEGGAGDDEFQMSHGDTALGGDGDDRFVITDLGEPGSDIYVTGGEGDETNGDVLDLQDLADISTLTLTNWDDDAGGYSGTIQLLDGTVVHFSEIEDLQDENGVSILSICFTPGTRILTEYGERPVETLRAGDLVLTRDEGLQPIRWIGTSTTDGTGDHAPILLAPEALHGARRQMLVSPQHRFVIQDWRNEVLFADPEVMVSAKHIVDGYSVMRAPCPRVTYIHLMLDRHQVIFAEGAATESFHAADHALTAMGPGTRESMFQALPHLRGDISQYGPTVRRCLRAHEAQLLLPANNAGPMAPIRTVSG